MSNVTVQSVVYQIDGQSYESRLVFSEGAEAAPGLVMAPNWMGISADAEQIAKEVADKGYVVLLADLYGQNVRPKNGDEAAAAMMPMKNDRALLNKRMTAALDQLTVEVEDRLNDTSRIAERLYSRLGLKVDVVCVPARSLPRGEHKSARFVDLRRDPGATP